MRRWSLGVGLIKVTFVEKGEVDGGKEGCRMRTSSLDLLPRAIRALARDCVVDVPFWDAEGALVVENRLEGGDDLERWY